MNGMQSIELIKLSEIDELVSRFSQSTNEEVLHGLRRIAKAPDILHKGRTLNRPSYNPVTA